MPDLRHIPSMGERMRLRELSKYYCMTSPACADTSIKSNENSVESPEPPRLSPDRTLTALVQLAACRLQCQRVVVSLIDDQIQYIIAEATQTISSFDANEHEPGDGLLFGVQPIPVDSGLCAQVLSAFTGASAFVLSGPGEVTSDHVFIPDVTKEMSACDLPALKAMPSAIRWYLSVPLKTATGYIIGAFSAMHPSIHDLGPKDVRVLQDMAKLVMQHLEQVRLMEDRQRAEHLLEGVSHFIRGKSSTSVWSSDASGSRHAVATDTLPEVNVSHLPQSTGMGEPSAVTISTPAISKAQISTSHIPQPVTGPVDPAKTDIESYAAASSSASNSVEDPESLLVSSNVSRTKSRPSLSSTTPIERAFSRAANLIRESMNLDISCFLEIPHNERFRHVRKNGVLARSNSESNSNEQPHSSSSSSDLAEAPTNSSDEEAMHSAESPLCHRLGVSSSLASSLIDNSTELSYVNIPSTLLQKLATRYPQGRIFHFDLSGNVTSGKDRPYAADTQTSTTQRQSLMSQLYGLFPSARSMIFLPLYDNDRQQVYAGFLGWTTNPTRSLQKREIMYLSGFAHSVMCEVMRLEALATDKTKSNFVSSVSHELRSPLHGILAAGQLLSESETLIHQTEFLNMIDISARTLLDILNHLLDHVKINRFVKQNTSEHQQTRSSKLILRQSLETNIDVASVVEETCLSMTGSYQTSRAKRDFELSDDLISARVETVHTSQVQRPLVILNLTNSASWTFLTESGSWRRIIMNLLGNSLKYTREGYVTLSLSKDLHPSMRHTSNIRLKITDTGQGISVEYLKHRLYTPFTQEDNLSIGTGLGLSLTQQVVKSLGGTIDVASQVGVGTEITVNVPLKEGTGSEQDKCVDLYIPLATKDLLAGQLVQITGLKQEHEDQERRNLIVAPQTRALEALDSSLSEILTSWLGMNMVNEGAQIHVVEESYLKSKSSVFDCAGNKLVIVSLEGNQGARQPLQQADSVHLTPPIGPGSLSRALVSLIAKPNHLSRNGRPTEPASETLHGIEKAIPTVGVSGTVTEKSQTRPVELPRSSALTRNTTDLQVKSTSGSSKYSTAILLVDDNAINLQILAVTIKRLKLEARGITYISAVNGQEAFDLYVQAVESRLKISTVFMDLSMPIMDGFQSTRAIRAYERSRGIDHQSRSTIIALTGLASAEARAEAMTCEFDLFLAKPVSPKTIREILQHRKVHVLAEDSGKEPSKMESDIIKHGSERSSHSGVEGSFIENAQLPSPAETAQDNLQSLRP